MQDDQQKELTSLLEMAKENGVGWRKEKVLTKAEETETANVNAAWSKMQALEAKLEADELKSMSLEDTKSAILEARAKLEAFERKAMAQEDTIEKANEKWRGYRKQRLKVRIQNGRWAKGLARQEKDGAQHKQKSVLGREKRKRRHGGQPQKAEEARQLAAGVRGCG